MASTRPRGPWRRTGRPTPTTPLSRPEPGSPAGSGTVSVSTAPRPARAGSNVALSGPFTIEAWVLNPANGAYETIATVGTNRDLYLGSGVITFYTGQQDLPFGAALAVGAWTHVALTYDNGVLRAYVNGIQQGPDRAVTLANVTAVLQIGAWMRVRHPELGLLVRHARRGAGLRPRAARPPRSRPTCRRRSQADDGRDAAGTPRRARADEVRPRGGAAGAAARRG